MPFLLDLLNLLNLDLGLLRSFLDPLRQLSPRAARPPSRC
jgi:hypothetical protein